MSKTEYKKLKLTVDDALAAIKLFANESRGSLDSQYNGQCHMVKITMPGMETASLSLYDKKDGLTIFPNLGKNVELSNKIAASLAGSVDKVTPYSNKFLGIHEELFSDLSEYLKECNCDILKTEPTPNHFQLSITRGKYTLTVHWYGSTRNLFVQGNTSSLLDDLLMWVGDKVIDNPKEFIDLLFGSLVDVEKQKIHFPDDVIEDELIKRLGSGYSNSRIVTEHEKKWLKTSCYLCTLDIELPEYYPAVSSSIKVVEGLLRRLCHHNFGAESFEGTNFAQFVGGGLNTLRPEFSSHIKDPSAIHCLENMYCFIATKRNAYQHTNGINPALVATRQIASDLFEEVINLVTEVERHSVKLL